MRRRFFSPNNFLVEQGAEKSFMGAGIDGLLFASDNNSDCNDPEVIGDLQVVLVTVATLIHEARTLGGGR